MLIFSIKDIHLPEFIGGKRPPVRYLLEPYRVRADIFAEPAEFFQLTEVAFLDYKIERKLIYFVLSLFASFLEEQKVADQRLPFCAPPDFFIRFFACAVNGHNQLHWEIMQVPEFLPFFRRKQLDVRYNRKTHIRELLDGQRFEEP